MHNKPGSRNVQDILYRLVCVMQNIYTFYWLFYVFANDAGYHPADNSDDERGQPGGEQFITDMAVDGVPELELRSRILVGDAGFDNQVIGAEQENDDSGDDKTAGKGFQ